MGAKLVGAPPTTSSIANGRSDRLENSSIDLDSTTTDGHDTAEPGYGAVLWLLAGLLAFGLVGKGIALFAVALADAQYGT